MRQQQEFWWLRRPSPGLDGADGAAQRGQRQCEREVTSLSEPNASARVSLPDLSGLDWVTQWDWQPIESAVIYCSQIK